MGAFLCRSSLVAKILAAVLFLTLGSSFTPLSIRANELQTESLLKPCLDVLQRGNPLLMKISHRNAPMTEGEISASTRTPHRLRIGAQVFSRPIAEPGNDAPQLGWSFVRHGFTDPSGARAGRAKRSLSVFVGTREVGFVHDWAFLPRSVSSTHIRATTITQVGGDISGDFKRHPFGKLSNVTYGDQPSDLHRAGRAPGARDLDFYIQQYRFGIVAASQWAAPPERLTVFCSAPGVHTFAENRIQRISGVPFPVLVGIPCQADGQEVVGNPCNSDLHLLTLQVRGTLSLTGQPNRLSGVHSTPSELQQPGGYAVDSYRVHRRLAPSTTSLVSSRPVPFPFRPPTALAMAANMPALTSK